MRVLITGLNSYIGNSFITWMRDSEWQMDKVSLRDEQGKDADWSMYDAVLHVAGIAHVDVAHAGKDVQDKYYRVNSQLTAEAAQKAKAEGVKQFLYMSSVIVYGDSEAIGHEKVITKQTEPAPSNFYGDSKLKGEQKILPLETETFKVTVIRTPMVYGTGSKGNFPKLKKLADITPVFPKIRNKRSMIYINNLCELIRICIEDRLNGIFLPQNKECISTSEFVKMIAATNGKKVMLIPGFTWIMKLLSHVTGYINKIFGNMQIDADFSRQELGYCIYSLEESLEQMKRESGE